MSGDAGADAALRWGVPDWRDAAAYPGSATTLVEWWWQFTRRHPDYRALWLDAAPRQAAFVEENKPQLVEMAHLTKVPVDWYLERQRDTPPLDKGLRARFRINFILNPTKSFASDDLLPYFQNDSVYEISLPSSRSFTASIEDMSGRALISFNLKKPLDRQLKDAKWLLEGQRQWLGLPKVVRRPRTASWALFLRALDARELAEATFGEMTAGFWPGQGKPEQAARDTYERACELRNYFPL